MKSDRDQRITSIFHSALERQGGERRAFLDGACAGDDELRHEVESLIQSHEQAGSLINAPAYERGAQLLEDIDHDLFDGRMLGHYRIARRLGGGGMGDVYLAEDTRLGRRVAIKILLHHFTSDASLIARFRQEARAASTLNHPNIVTIYEVGEADGTHFIATEFVEGVTLREYLASKQLSVREAIDIATQITAALVKAHQSGVVHRDVKPENIMVDGEGHAKILDFGIAKLTEQKHSPTTEAPTMMKVETSPGTVIGTAHYMSPEQVRALKDIDARTDIWSVGVVLYEMLSGRLPFNAATSSDVMAEILSKEPMPLARFNPDVSEALELVAQKALTKDRDERYQTAKELAADLKRVRQRLEVGTTSDGERHISLIPGGDTIHSGTVRTREPVAVPTTSSAEYIVKVVSRHKRGTIAAFAILVLVGSAVGYGIYKYRNSSPSPGPIFENVSVHRITTSGRAKEANISPDGRYVVYVEEDSAGNLGVLVRQTATGNTLQIVPPSKNLILGTAFSLDSDFVYYLATDRSSDVAWLYRVPSIGGSPSKVLDDIDSPITFSPDGRRLAFIREERDLNYELIVANIDGTAERVLTTRSGFDFFIESGPSWSPDGKTIASPAGTADQKTGEVSLFLLGIDVDTGVVRELSPKRWAGGVARVAWMPDGSALMLVAADKFGDPTQIWSVSYPSGDTRRITNDVQARDHRSLGVTADGRTLISVSLQSNSRIEIVPQNGDTRVSTRLSTADTNRDGAGVAWTPENRIVFGSSEGGQSDLWVMNSDGSQRMRLTSDVFRDWNPAVSPDGRYIVFASNRARGGWAPQLWRMNIDGSNPIQLTHAEDNYPGISKDGRWVIYSSWAPGNQGLVTGETLWKVSIDGGAPVQVTDYTVQAAAFSPDGNWIAGIVYDDQVVPKRWRNAIIAASGGKPVKQFDRPNYEHQFVRWTRDGKNLSYIGPPAIPSNIWLQPVNGGEPRRLTDYKAEMIFSHSWSNDGKYLAIVRGNITTDVVLMRDSK